MVYRRLGALKGGGCYTILMDEKGERYDRGDIERIFRNAVPDEVYERLLADPDSISPAGAEREFAIMFSDIREFTTHVGTMTPREGRDFLGAVLEASEEAVIGHGGFLEKFVGDEVMAMFGAVGDQPPREQALAACGTALDFRESYGRLGVRFGIGINLGKAYIGNYGTRKRPYYTVFGDEINLAANLEGWNKNFRHDIAVTESLADLVRGEYRVVPADFIHIKRGLHPGPRKAFVLIDREDSLTAERRSLWDRYEAAWEALEAGRFEEAVAELGRLKDAPGAIPFLGFAYDRARSKLIESIGSRLATAESLPALHAALAAALAGIFPGAEPGLAAPAEDGTWRFIAAPGFAAPPVILAPDGEIVVWLKGVDGACRSSEGGGAAGGPTDAAGPVRDATCREGPPAAAAELPFGAAAPLRFRNEAVGALLVALPSPSESDLELLAAVAEKLSRPFGELSLAAYRERYREKASAEERLSAANWELEAQSLELQRAMADIRALNSGLEGRVREQVERLERAWKLKRYLPPDLVEEVLEGRKRLEPSFERRKITVFFSDVRGFTAATDALEPEELARLLNEYLSAMSDIAFRRGATIDKFRGDGMMILFGAPERMEPADSARRCAAMAVEMCRATERLKAKWDDEGYDWDIGVRMGVNTGYATVGEFGCEERMDYTAIGSEVNLASRLETACEAGEITLSHAAYALVKDAFPCAPRGEVSVKGISRPIRVYELLWREASPEV